MVDFIADPLLWTLKAGLFINGAIILVVLTALVIFLRKLL